jgi:hypothetical protein
MMGLRELNTGGGSETGCDNIGVTRMAVEIPFCPDCQRGRSCPTEQRYRTLELRQIVGDVRDWLGAQALGPELVRGNLWHVITAKVADLTLEDRERTTEFCEIADESAFRTRAGWLINGVENPFGAGAIFATARAVAVKARITRQFLKSRVVTTKSPFDDLVSEKREIKCDGKLRSLPRRQFHEQLVLSRYHPRLNDLPYEVLMRRR